MVFFFSRIVRKTETTAPERKNTGGKERSEPKPWVEKGKSAVSSKLECWRFAGRSAELALLTGHSRARPSDQHKPHSSLAVPYALGDGN